MKTKLKKLSDDVLVKRQNELVQNISKKQTKKKKKDWPCLSERQLKADPLDIPKRYNSQFTQPITFANWKQKVSVDENSNRLEKYEKMRVNQIYRQSKQNRDEFNLSKKTKPIFPINNKVVNRFQLSGHQALRQNKTVYLKQDNNKFRSLDLQERKNLKKKFQNLYLKQKQEYQKILKRYGIIEKVDDSEFKTFLALI